MLSARSRWAQQSARTAVAHTWGRAAAAAAAGAAATVQAVSAQAAAPASSGSSSSGTRSYSTLSRPVARSVSGVVRASSCVRAAAAPAQTHSRTMAKDAKAEGKASKADKAEAKGKKKEAAAKEQGSKDTTAQANATPAAASATPAAAVSAPKAADSTEPSIARITGNARIDSVNRTMAAAKIAADAKRAARKQRRDAVHESGAADFADGADEEDAEPSKESTPTTPSSLVVAWKFPRYFDPRFEPPPLNSFRKPPAGMIRFKFQLFDPSTIGTGINTAEGLKLRMDEGALILWHQRYQAWISGRVERNALKFKQRAEYIAKGYPTRLTASEEVFQAFVCSEEFHTWLAQAEAEPDAHKLDNYSPSLEPSNVFPFAREADTPTPGTWHPSFEPINPELWEEYNITARDSEEYAQWFHAWLKANPAAAKQREIYQRMVRKYVGPIWRARMHAETAKITENESIRASMRAQRIQDHQEEFARLPEETEAFKEADEMILSVDPSNPHDPRYSFTAEDEQAITTLADPTQSLGEEFGITSRKIRETIAMESDPENLADVYDAMAAERLEEIQGLQAMPDAAKEDYRQMRLAQWRASDFSSNYVELPESMERRLYADRFAPVSKEDVELEKAILKHGNVNDHVLGAAWYRVQKALAKASAIGRAEAKKAIQAQIEAGTLKPTEADRAAAAAEIAKETTMLRAMPMAIYRRVLHNRVAWNQEAVHTRMFPLEAREEGGGPELDEEDRDLSPLDLEDEPDSIEGTQLFDVTEEADPLDPLPDPKLDMGSPAASLTLLEQAHLNGNIQHAQRAAQDHALVMSRMDGKPESIDDYDELAEEREEEEEEELENDPLLQALQGPEEDLKQSLAEAAEDAEGGAEGEAAAKRNAYARSSIEAAIGDIPAPPSADAAAAPVEAAAAPADADAAPAAAPAAAEKPAEAVEPSSDVEFTAEETALLMRLIQYEEDRKAPLTALGVPALASGSAAPAATNAEAGSPDVVSPEVAREMALAGLNYDGSAAPDLAQESVAEVIVPGSRREAELDAFSKYEWPHMVWAAVRDAQAPAIGRLVASLPKEQQDAYRTFAALQAEWDSKTAAQQEALARQVIASTRPDVKDESEIAHLVKDYCTEHSSLWNAHRPPLGTESWSREQLVAFLPKYLSSSVKNLAQMHQRVFEPQLEYLLAQSRLSDEFRAQEQCFKREVRAQLEKFVEQALAKQPIAELTARAQLMSEKALLVSLTAEQKQAKAAHDAAREQWNKLSEAEKNAAAERAVSTGEAKAIRSLTEEEVTNDSWWPSETEDPTALAVRRTMTVQLWLAKQKGNKDAPAVGPAPTVAESKTKQIEDYKRARAAPYVAHLAAEKRATDKAAELSTVSHLEAKLTEKDSEAILDTVLHAVTPEDLVRAPGSQVWSQVPLGALTASAQKLAAEDPYAFSDQLRDALYRMGEETEYEAQAPARAAVETKLRDAQQRSLERFIAALPETQRVVCNFHSVEEAVRAGTIDIENERQRRLHDEKIHRQDNPELYRYLAEYEEEVQHGRDEDDPLDSQHLPEGGFLARNEGLGAKYAVILDKRVTRALDNLSSDVDAMAKEAEDEKEIDPDADDEALVAAADEAADLAEEEVDEAEAADRKVLADLMAQFTFTVDAKTHEKIIDDRDALEELEEELEERRADFHEVRRTRIAEGVSTIDITELEQKELTALIELEAKVAKLRSVPSDPYRAERRYAAKVAAEQAAEDVRTSAWINEHRALTGLDHEAAVVDADFENALTEAEQLANKMRTAQPQLDDAFIESLEAEAAGSADVADADADAVDEDPDADLDQPLTAEYLEEVQAALKEEQGDDLRPDPDDIDDEELDMLEHALVDEKFFHEAIKEIHEEEREDNDDIRMDLFLDRTNDATNEDVHEITDMMNEGEMGYNPVDADVEPLGDLSLTEEVGWEDEEENESIEEMVGRTGMLEQTLQEEQLDIQTDVFGELREERERVLAAVMGQKPSFIQSWQRAGYDAVLRLEQPIAEKHRRRLALWDEKGAQWEADYEAAEQIWAEDAINEPTVSDEMEAEVEQSQAMAMHAWYQELEQARAPYEERSIFSFHCRMEAIGPGAHLLAEELARYCLANHIEMDRDELEEKVRLQYPDWSMNMRCDAAVEWKQQWEDKVKPKLIESLTVPERAMLEPLPKAHQWKLSDYWISVHNGPAAPTPAEWIARVLLFQATPSPAELARLAEEKELANRLQETMRFTTQDIFDIEWEEVLAERRAKKGLPENDPAFRKEMEEEYYIEPDMQPYLADAMIPNPHVVGPEPVIDDFGHTDYLVQDESQLYQPFRTDVSIPIEVRAAGSMAHRTALHHFEIRRRPDDEIEEDISAMRMWLDGQSREDHEAPHGRILNLLRDIEDWKRRQLEPKEKEMRARAKELHDKDRASYPHLLPASTEAPKPIPVTSDVPIKFSPSNPVPMEREDTASLLRVSVNDQLGQAEDTAELTLNLRDESITTDEHPLVLVEDTEVDEDTLHELIMRQIEEYEILGIDKFGRVLTQQQIDLTPMPIMKKALARVGYLPNPYSDPDTWKTRTIAAGSDDLYNRDAMIELYHEEFALESREERLRAHMARRNSAGELIDDPLDKVDEEFLEFRDAFKDMEPELLEVMSEEEIATWKSYTTDEGMVQWIAEGGLFKTQAEWAKEIKGGRTLSLDQLEGSMEDLPLQSTAANLTGNTITFEENDEIILKQQTDRMQTYFEDLKLLQYNPELFVEYFDATGSGEFTEAGKKEIMSVLSRMEDPQKRITYLKTLLEWKKVVAGDCVHEDKWTMKLWIEQQRLQGEAQRAARKIAAVQLNGPRKKGGDEIEGDDVMPTVEADEEPMDAAEMQEKLNNPDDDEGEEGEGDDGPLKAADGSLLDASIFEEQDVMTGEMVKFRYDEEGNEVPLTKFELDQLPKAPLLSLDQELERAENTSIASLSLDTLDAEESADEANEDEGESGGENAAEDEDEGDDSDEIAPGQARKKETTKDEDEAVSANSPDAVHPMLAVWAKPSTLRHVKELPHMDSDRYNEFQAMLYLKQKVYKMLNDNFPASTITLKMNQPMLFYPERKFRQHYADTDPNLSRAISGGHSSLQLFQVIFLMRKYRNASILAEHIAKEIGGTKSHSSVLRQVENLVKWMEAIPGLDTGLMIKVSGRINGAARASHYVIKSGNIPLQTVHANIDYALAHAHARIGVFGVKVWLFQRKLDRKEMQAQALNKKLGRTRTKYL